MTTILMNECIYIFIVSIIFIIPKLFSYSQNVKLPSELPCKQVHQKVLRDLSNEIPWWKFLARALEVPDNAIERIYLDYQNDSREQCYQMLRKWTQINGQNATYQHLGRALKTEVEEAYPKYVDIVTSYLS